MCLLLSCKPCVCFRQTRGRVLQTTYLVRDACCCGDDRSLLGADCVLVPRVMMFSTRPLRILANPICYALGLGTSSPSVYPCGAVDALVYSFPYPRAGQKAAGGVAQPTSRREAPLRRSQTDLQAVRQRYMLMHLIGYHVHQSVSGWTKAW